LKRKLEKRSSWNSIEYKLKVEFKMDQNLTVREHQKTQDKLKMMKLEMNDEYDTSDICHMYQRQLIGAIVEVTKI
jgi:hypothetical protein